MKKSKAALLSLSLVFSFSAFANISVPTEDQLVPLSAQKQHAIACSRTANYFLRAHYNQVNLDQDFIKRVIGQYLSFLDYNRSLFMQQEVDDIYKNANKIYVAISLCDLSYPYEIYNANLKRRFEKYQYFLKLIKSNIDVNGDDTIQIDRSKASFAKDEAQLHELWNKELKNEYINQILLGNTQAQAKDRIIKRYQTALHRLTQTNSEDVFSSFENAFATSIDPHTSYLSPDDSENFNDNINLSLEGIGAVLSQEDEYTVINSILPGSPAALSKKLKPKDKIVAVKQEDGKYEDIRGWRLNDAVKKIKGPKGSSVSLEIQRGDGANISTFVVTLVRDKIKLQDRAAKIEVKKVGDKNIGVLSIQSFYTDLHKDIQKELKRVQKDNIKALVIDLRSNSGGLLPEATLSSGLFIKDGPIVCVRDAQGNIIPQNDTDKNIDYQGPIVLLINRLSASSSEIMAAALKDYGRAIVVGDTSFGKGTVQQNRPLARVYDFQQDKTLGSIHYTIAKFYRINGGSTQLKGVSPDIYFPPLIDNEQIGERNEKYALSWDQISPVAHDDYTPKFSLNELIKNHEKRIKDNVAFSIMKSEFDRYQIAKKEKFLSLNLEKRKIKRDEDDKIKLKEVNLRLEQMGKKPIKSLKDLPDDFEFSDEVLNETLYIASDLDDNINKYKNIKD